MSSVSSLKFQSVVWLLAMALSAATGEVICPEGSTEANRPERCIGVEMGLEGVTKTTKSRRLLRGPQSPLMRGASIAPTLANRRSLLQAQCSYTDSGPAAVISCTNAVRSNPGAFEYRCGNDWVSQYQGRGPLSYSAELERAAQLHSEDQARRDRIGHTGSDRSSVSDRAYSAGYPLGSVTENVAFGYVSARDVVIGWMCSPGHRRSIMSCDTINIGVGVADNGRGSLYHTQVFGCPSGASCTCAGDPDNAGSSAPPSQEASREPSPTQETPGFAPTTTSTPPLTGGGGSSLFGGSSPTPSTLTPVGSSSTPTTITPSRSDSTPTTFTQSRSDTIYYIFPARTDNNSGGTVFSPASSVVPSSTTGPTYDSGNNSGTTTYVVPANFGGFYGPFGR